MKKEEPHWGTVTFVNANSIHELFSFHFTLRLVCRYFATSYLYWWKIFIEIEWTWWRECPARTLWSIFACEPKDGIALDAIVKLIYFQNKLVSVSSSGMKKLRRMWSCWMRSFLVKIVHTIHFYIHVNLLCLFTQTNHWKTIYVK